MELSILLYNFRRRFSNFFILKKYENRSYFFVINNV
jgi:hypothetical protein